MDKKLTYFTPTYNRAHTLPKLYESLVEQTNKNFVWLIIDDGSTDNTKELVESWAEEKKIEIEYIVKKNGGKHTAIDFSNQVCKTEFINCIDSDDYVSKDSTEVLYKYLDEVSKNENLCGIVARRAHYDGTAFNEAFPKEPTNLYFNEIAKVYGYTQDTNLIFKTDVIKNYHFPVFEDERFVTESVFYNQFMYKYQMLAIPELLYLAEYQQDGYSAQGMRLFYKNPKGFLYSLKQEIKIGIERRVGLLRLVKRTAVYLAYKDIFKNPTILPEFKIPFIYRILGGNFLKWHFKQKYKKEYELFLKG